MLRLTHAQMLRAMQTNDASYDGKFYVGVVSTGIYCLPSCKARLPRPENVVFYPTREAAVAAGLRGCKRCRSEQFPDVLPEWLPAVLAFMQAHPGDRLTEERLIGITGVDISTVRRYFKQQHGTTPLAFHRKVRLEHARRLMEDGADYLSAAYDSGFESASGFRDAFVREFGRLPGGHHSRAAEENT